MPKGVEHIDSHSYRVVSKGVESLMPKGVEHTLKLFHAHYEIMCWISDAERRWAHEAFAKARSDRDKCWISDAERRWARVSKRVTKSLLKVLNLWCRKALSTQFQLNYSTDRLACWISDAERRWALSTSKAALNTKDGVESLMPKGVEHNIIFW